MNTNLIQINHNKLNIKLQDINYASVSATCCAYDMIFILRCRCITSRVQSTYAIVRALRGSILKNLLLSFLKFSNVSLIHNVYSLRHQNVRKKIQAVVTSGLQFLTTIIYVHPLCRDIAELLSRCRDVEMHPHSILRDYLYLFLLTCIQQNNREVVI